MALYLTMAFVAAAAIGGSVGRQSVLHWLVEDARALRNQLERAVHVAAPNELPPLSPPPQNPEVDEQIGL